MSFEGRQGSRKAGGGATYQETAPTDYGIGHDTDPTTVPHRGCAPETTPGVTPTRVGPRDPGGLNCPTRRPGSRSSENRARGPEDLPNGPPSSRVVDDEVTGDRLVTGTWNTGGPEPGSRHGGVRKGGRVSRRGPTHWGAGVGRAYVSPGLGGSVAHGPTPVGAPGTLRRGPRGVRVRGHRRRRDTASDETIDVRENKTKQTKEHTVKKRKHRLGGRVRTDGGVGGRGRTKKDQEDTAHVRPLTPRTRRADGGGASEGRGGASDNPSNRTGVAGGSAGSTGRGTGGGASGFEHPRGAPDLCRRETSGGTPGWGSGSGTARSGSTGCSETSRGSGWGRAGRGVGPEGGDRKQGSTVVGTRADGTPTGGPGVGGPNLVCGLDRGGMSTGEWGVVPRQGRGGGSPVDRCAVSSRADRAGWGAGAGRGRSLPTGPPAPS